QLGEFDDLLLQALDVVVGHTEQRRVQVDVATAREFRVEARAQFQQGSDLTLDEDTAAAGLQGAYQQFHQGGFAGTVVADDAEAAPFQNREGNILQHMEEVMTRFARQQFDQPVLRARIDTEVLVDIFKCNAVHLKYIPECVTDAHEQPAAQTIAQYR